jgi:methionine synthase I (cobalamin-dependent)
MPGEDSIGDMEDGPAGRDRLLELLSSGEAVIADGAMGTSLMAMGLPPGDAPETWLIGAEGRAAIASVHAGFVEAGSDVLLTCSFGTARWRLARHGLGDRAAELARSAAEIAIEVARGAARQRVLVAGSIGPSGELLEPYGTLPATEAADGFAEVAAGLAAGGVDGIWVETMSDLAEATAAVEGARQAAPDLPIVATMAFGSGARTTFGVKATDAVRALADLGVVAAGVNCGGSLDDAETALLAMAGAGTGLPLVFKPNAGLPVLVDGRASYPESPVAMAASALRARQSGATVVGSCCGGTAAHVRAIAEALAKPPG